MSLDNCSPPWNNFISGLRGGFSETGSRNKWLLVAFNRALLEQVINMFNCYNICRCIPMDLFQISVECPTSTVQLAWRTWSRCMRARQAVPWPWLACRSRLVLRRLHFSGYAVVVISFKHHLFFLRITEFFLLLQSTDGWRFVWFYCLIAWMFSIHKYFVSTNKHAVNLSVNIAGSPPSQPSFIEALKLKTTDWLVMQLLSTGQLRLAV